MSNTRIKDLLGGREIKWRNGGNLKQIAVSTSTVSGLGNTDYIGAEVSINSQVSGFPESQSLPVSMEPEQSATTMATPGVDDNGNIITAPAPEQPQGYVPFENAAVTSDVNAAMPQASAAPLGSNIFDSPTDVASQGAMQGIPASAPASEVAPRQVEAQASSETSISERLNAAIAKFNEGIEIIKEVQTKLINGEKAVGEALDTLSNQATFPSVGAPMQPQVDTFNQIPGAASIPQMPQTAPVNPVMPNISMPGYEQTQNEVAPGMSMAA